MDALGQFYLPGYTELELNAHQKKEMPLAVLLKQVDDFTTEQLQVRTDSMLEVLHVVRDTAQQELIKWR